MYLEKLIELCQPQLILLEMMILQQFIKNWGFIFQKIILVFCIFTGQVCLEIHQKCSHHLLKIHT